MLCSSALCQAHYRKNQAALQTDVWLLTVGLREVVSEMGGQERVTETGESGLRAPRSQQHSPAPCFLPMLNTALRAGEGDVGVAEGQSLSAAQRAHSFQVGNKVGLYLPALVRRSDVGRGGWGQVLAKVSDRARPTQDSHSRFWWCIRPPVHPLPGNAYQRRGRGKVSEKTGQRTWP